MDQSKIEDNNTQGSIGEVEVIEVVDGDNNDNGDKDDADDEKEFEKKLMEEIENDDENIVDEEGTKIELPKPSIPELEQLRENIMKLDPDERRNFLANIAKSQMVNPNNNRFNVATERDILKEKIRRIRRAFAMNRKTKSAIKTEQKKKEELQNKLMAAMEDLEPIDNEEAK